LAWDVAPLPRGKERATLVRVRLLGINRQCPDPGGVFGFLQFLGRDEAQQILAEQGRSLPSNPAFTEAPTGQNPAFAGLTHPEFFIESLRTGRPSPQSPQWRAASRILLEETEGLFDNRATARQALQKAQARIDRLAPSPPLTEKIRGPATSCCQFGANP